MRTSTEVACDVTVRPAYNFRRSRRASTQS